MPWGDGNIWALSVGNELLENRWSTELDSLSDPKQLIPRYCSCLRTKSKYSRWLSNMYSRFGYCKIKTIKIWHDKNSIFGQLTCWTIEIRKDAVFCWQLHAPAPKSANWVASCKFLVLCLLCSLIGTDTWSKFIKETFATTHANGYNPSPAFKF